MTAPPESCSIFAWLIYLSNLYLLDVIGISAYIEGVIAMTHLGVAKVKDIFGKLSKRAAMSQTNSFNSFPAESENV